MPEKLATSSNSDLTLYQNAVAMELNLGEGQGQEVMPLAEPVEVRGNGNNRFSSSSDETGEADTSDEIEPVICLPLNKEDENRLNKNMQCICAVNDQVQFENFVGAQLKEFREQQCRTDRTDHQSCKQPEQNNRGRRDGDRSRYNEQEEMQEIEAMAAQEVQHAEAVKAHQNDVTGKGYARGGGLEFGFVHSMFVDEDYSMMGGHVDNATRSKIINGEYVDFARLLPRDRLSDNDDKRMELVNRNGYSYWIPAERDGGSITSFYRWE